VLYASTAIGLRESLRTLGNTAQARLLLRPARYGAARVVTTLVGLLAAMDAGAAAVYGAFAEAPGINMSAVTSDAATARMRVMDESVPVRTAYVELVNRLRVTPLADLSEGVKYRSVDIPSPAGSIASLTGLRDLADPANMEALELTLNVLLNASTTTGWGRAAQAVMWAEQFLGPGSTIAADAEAAAAFGATSAIWAAFVLVVVAIQVVAYRHQQRSRRVLERQLEQRAILQHAVAAFVPRAFLGIMGYSSISGIRHGDHRMVDLTMLFCSVHNYNMLGAGNRVERMFNFQQNLMTTCTEVTRRNNGFPDKFLGDGCFLLFVDGLDGVIAAVELYQESQDLAVRKKKPKGHRSFNQSTTSDRASSHRGSSYKLNRAESVVSKNHKSVNDETATVASDGDSFHDNGDGDSRGRSVKPGAAVNFNRHRRRHSAESGHSDSHGSRPAERTQASGSHSGSGGREDINEEDRCQIGIGLHSGPVCVGILGDDQRHSCTLISSKVNLASRLCKLTQKLKIGILLSQETYSSCGQEIEEEVGHYLRRFGSVKVYGQKIATEVIELFACDEPEIRDYKLSTSALWREGMELQSYMRWDDASTVFDQVKAEGDALLRDTDSKGIDGKKFVDVPLELNRRLKSRHHVFLEK
jgi:class 3 adenylate cyclase